MAQDKGAPYSFNFQPNYGNPSLENYCRSQANIEGLTVGGKVHKIHLIADEIILMLSNPSSSLASVNKTLDNFSLVYYYKVNATKSFILPLEVSAKPWARLTLTFGLKIQALT